MRNFQSQNSVAQVQAGNIFGMVAVAGSAHRIARPKHRCLGKRPSDPTRYRTWSLGDPRTTTGDDCSPELSDEQLSLRERPRSVSVEQPVRVARVTGDPAAALWAAMVLSRAMCS